MKNENINREMMKGENLLFYLPVYTSINRFVRLLNICLSQVLLSVVN